MAARDNDVIDSRREWRRRQDALELICCCRWDHALWVRTSTNPLCALHGINAPPTKTLAELRRDEAKDKMIARETRLEARRQIRLYKAAKGRLKRTLEQLLELGE